jgi:hypothetical protein
MSRFRRRSGLAERVGSRRALLGADHRGRVWEPFEGSHYNGAKNFQIAGPAKGAGSCPFWPLEVPVKVHQMAG